MSRHLPPNSRAALKVWVANPTPTPISGTHEQAEFMFEVSIQKKTSQVQGENIYANYVTDMMRPWLPQPT